MSNIRDRRASWLAACFMALATSLGSLTITGCGGEEKEKEGALQHDRPGGEIQIAANLGTGDFEGLGYF